MNKDIIMIIQACDSLRVVKRELSKRNSLFKIKDKRECKQLEAMIRSRIKELTEAEWTIDYLFSLQHALKAYSRKFTRKMMENIYISEDGEDPTSQSVFSTMYFNDTDKNTKIILDIIGDTITFTIFDNTTGNTFSVSSKARVQESQKKIESVCKEILIELLESYCDFCCDVSGKD